MGEPLPIIRAQARGLPGDPAPPRQGASIESGPPVISSATYSSSTNAEKGSLRKRQTSMHSSVTRSSPS